MVLHIAGHLNISSSIMLLHIFKYLLVGCGVSCVLSFVQPLCDPIDRSALGSSVHGISQARILEWVVIPSPGDPPNPGIESTSLASPALAGGFFTSN